MYKLFLAFLIFILFIIGGCGRGPDPQELLPGGGEILVFLKTKRVMEDRDLARAMGIEELKDDLREMDLSLENFSLITTFASFSPREYSGMIFQGDHSAIKKIKRQIEKGGWREKGYSKDKYFYDPSSKQCAVTLNNLLVFGSEEAIKDVLDVYRDRKQGKSSDPSYLRLTGSIDPESAPVVAYLLPSQKLLDMSKAGLESMKLILSIFKVKSIGRFLGKIGVVKGMAMSIDRSGDSFPVRISCLMQSETAASLVSGLLNLLKGAVNLLSFQEMSERDKEDLILFQSMEISRKGDMLKIEMEVPRQVLLESE